MLRRTFSTARTVFQDKSPGTLHALLVDSVNKVGSKNRGSNSSQVPNVNDKIFLPPRTGAYVGRSAPVLSPQMLSNTIRQVNVLNSQNKVMQTKRLQRFAERPGKARLRLRIERKRREFQTGIRRLFDLVNEARRKGY